MLRLKHWTKDVLGVIAQFSWKIYIIHVFFRLEV